MLPYHSNTSNLTTSSAPSSSNMKQNNRKKDLIKQELDVDQLLQPSPSKSFAIFDLNSPITSLSRSITLETSPSAAGTPMNMDPHRFHESSPLQHSPSTTLAPYISDFSHHQSHHHNTSSSGGLAFHSSTPLSSPSTAPPIRYVSATTGGSLSTPNNSHTPTMSGNTGNITKNSLQFPLTSSSELPMPFGLSTPTSFNNLTTPTLGSGLFSSSSPSGAPPFSSNTPQSSNNNSSSNNGILNTLNSSIPNQSINSNNHHENITQLPPIHPPSESIVNQQQHHQPHNLHVQQHQQQHPQIVQQHQQPHIIHQPNNLTQPTQSGTVYKSPQPSSSQNNQFKPLNSPTSSYHSDEEAKPKDRIVVIPDTGSATGTISIDTEGLMIIEEGFDLPPPNPQPGGKQNKKPLPRHIISVNVSAIPRYQFYSIKVSLLGYKTKQKEVLKDILDPVLLSKSKPNMRGDAQRVDMHFDTITIDEASHMNGRKFFLRFSLLSPDKLPVTHVDSSYFETITDRGNQKRQQKIDHSRSKISKVLRVSPRYSIVQGGQLVKVLLNQQIVAPSNVYVYFGDKRARCIYVSPHKDNTIVCETPDGNADEEVEVKVSLDKGKTFMATDASLRYIPMGNLSVPNDPQGRMSPLSMPFMVNQNEMRLKKNFPAPPISNDDEYYDESPEQEQYDDYETVQSNNPLNFVNNSNMSNSQQQQPIVINSQMNNQQMSSRQFGLANNALVNSINNMNNMNSLGNMGLNNNAVNLNNLNNMNNNMNNMNNMNMNGNNGMNNMNNNMNNMNSMSVNMNNMNNNMNMNNMNGQNNLPLNIASMGINPNTMNNLNNNNNNGFNQQMFNQSHLQNQFHNYHNK